MKSIRTILIAMAAAGVLFSAAAVPVEAAARDKSCLSDQETQAAIAAGQIKTWSKVRVLAGVPADYYETSDTRVCKRAGGLFYIVTMASTKGEQFKYVLNAVDGSS